jgi:hypothetical protein
VVRVWGGAVWSSAAGRVPLRRWPTGEQGSPLLRIPPLPPAHEGADQIHPPAHPHLGALGEQVHGEAQADADRGDGQGEHEQRGRHALAALERVACHHGADRAHQPRENVDAILGHVVCGGGGEELHVYLFYDPEFLVGRAAVPPPRSPSNMPAASSLTGVGVHGLHRRHACGELAPQAQPQEHALQEGCEESGVCVRASAGRQAGRHRTLAELCAGRLAARWLQPGRSRAAAGEAHAHAPPSLADAPPRGRGTVRRQR